MQLILTVSVIHLIACLSPGPDVFLVVLNSLRYGWRTGITTTSGILTGVSLQITLGIAGVSYIVTQHPGLHATIALAGGAWLIYLGIRGFWSHSKNPSGAATDAGPSGRITGLFSAWSQGLLVNSLNPKALLYFFSLFSGLLGVEVGLSTRIGCGLAMLATQAVAFSTVAVLLSRPELKDRWMKLQSWLERIICVILLGIGIWIWITTLLSLSA